MNEEAEKYFLPIINLVSISPRCNHMANIAIQRIIYLVLILICNYRDETEKTLEWITTTVENYLPSTADIVISLTLDDTTTVDGSPFVTLRLKNAGCFSSGKVTLPLLSMATTCDMVGRSAALSCTQSRAMLIHLIVSSV
jgi:hypothetical protein